MRDGEERGETRGANDQGKNEKIKSEFTRGAKRKVPKSALVGAFSALALCIVVIIVVVLVVGGAA